MTTTLIERPANSQPEQILITVTPQVIQETIHGMMLLKIEGIDDRQGRELVSTARKQVVKLRTTAEKERVAIKEQALEECRRIDKQWKDLFALIEPVENYLKAQEDAVKQAEKKLEESKLAEIRNARRRMAPCLAYRWIRARRRTLDRFLSLSALLDRGERERARRSPTPLARLVPSHQGMQTSIRFWRASVSSYWARVARWSIRRHGRSGLHRGGGRTGSTQRQGTAHQAASVLGIQEK